MLQQQPWLCGGAESGGTAAAAEEFAPGPGPPETPQPTALRLVGNPEPIAGHHTGAGGPMSELQWL